MEYLERAVTKHFTALQIERRLYTNRFSEN